MADEVRYEWDEAKRTRNLDWHGVDFTTANRFVWSEALTIDQMVGGERRHLTFGPIGARLFVMVWTSRGRSVRIISLRKANKRERRAYEKA